jgi:hypothetical protein
MCCCMCAGSIYTDLSTIYERAERIGFDILCDTVTFFCVCALLHVCRLHVH